MLAASSCVSCSCQGTICIYASILTPSPFYCCTENDFNSHPDNFYCPALNKILFLFMSSTCYIMTAYKTYYNCRSILRKVHTGYYKCYRKLDIVADKIGSYKKQSQKSDAFCTAMTAIIALSRSRKYTVTIFQTEWRPNICFSFPMRLLTFGFTQQKYHFYQFGYLCEIVLVLARKFCKFVFRPCHGDLYPRPPTTKF